MQSSKFRSVLTLMAAVVALGVVSAPAAATVVSGDRDASPPLVIDPLMDPVTIERLAADRVAERSPSRKLRADRFRFV